MADTLTIEMDTGPLEAALNRLGDVAQPFINEASATTAANVAREARARLRRQLTGGYSTGETEAAISSRPAYDNNGSVVVVERADMPNLPLWLEKGTKRGKPGSHDAAARPFFYVSAQLEAGAHVRRLNDALARAADTVGLGE